MKRRLALALVAILLICLFPAALGDEITFTGTVTGGSLNMRKEPSSGAKVVSTYKNGTEVTVLENDGTWCKVQVGSKTGYMMTQYLNITANYPHLGWGRSIETDALVNIHSLPDFYSEIIYKSASPLSFELVEKINGWYKIRFGNQFGYLPVEMVSTVNGEFSAGIAAEDLTGALRATDLYSALRECGNPRTMERTDHTFTYSVTWPDTGIPAADDLMSNWIQKTLNQYEADYNTYYPGAKAHCRIEYQALQIDQRYQSILLMAEYQAGGLRTDSILTVNLDTATGAVLDAASLLKDAGKALFILETEISDIMKTPTDGYTGKANESMLRNALLTRDGLCIYLPAGMYLPSSLGLKRILIPWAQIAESAALDSPLISQYIRTIDPTKPMIALTFDDGPSEQTTRILDVLDQYGGKATFCVQGINVEKHADIVRRAVAGGHEIASHTWNHKKLTELSVANIRSQLQRTNDIVKKVTDGYEIKVLRPPYGSVNKNVRTVCAEMDMVIAHWKLDTLDWDTRSTSKTYRAIMKGAQNGVIVLCHDLYSSTAGAIEQAVPELVAKGYQLVTVSELLSFHKDGAQPGTVYAYLDPQNIRAD